MKQLVNVDSQPYRFITLKLTPPVCWTPCLYYNYGGRKEANFAPEVKGLSIPLLIAEQWATFCGGDPESFLPQIYCVL